MRSERIKLHGLALVLHHIYTCIHRREISCVICSTSLARSREQSTYVSFSLSHIYIPLLHIPSSQQFARSVRRLRGIVPRGRTTRTYDRLYYAPHSSLMLLSIRILLLVGRRNYLRASFLRGYNIAVLA